MTPEQFMANFGAIAEAPDGVDKLRGMVLSLGVSGRLQTGSPEDEHGEVLLGRAAKERDKRFADGRARKSKLPNPPEATSWEFDPPAGWLWTRAGLVFDVAGGLQKSPKRTPKKNHFPYLRVANVQRGRLDLAEIMRFELEPGELEKLRLEAGDLLVVEGNGSEKEIGRCAVWDGSIENCVHQNHLIRCRPLGGVLPEFVLRFLNSPFGMAQMKSLAVTTSGLYNLSVGKIRNIPIPLPPLAEQKRIVAKVDQLMAMLDDLEQRQEKKRTVAIHVSKASLDSLVNAEDPDQLARAWERVSKNFGVVAGAEHDALRTAIVSMGAFGRLSSREPGETAEDTLRRARAEHEQAVAEKVTKRAPNKGLPARPLPEGWRWAALGELLTFGPRNGLSPKPVEYETSVMGLTLSATTRGVFDPSATKFVDVEVEDDSYLWLRAGDILVQRGNTFEYVGVPALYDGEPGRFIYPDLMMKIRVSDALDRAFVHLAMSETTARDYLRARASGTSGSMPKINQGTLLSLPLPIPPLAEQKRIVAKVNRLTTMLDDLADKSGALTTAAERLALAGTSAA